MRELIDHIQQGGELSPVQVQTAVQYLVDPSGDESLKADFLRSLRDKGETAGEIAAFVRALLAHAVDPGVDPAALDKPVIDVCGTGGDRMGLFNVSTTAMFVVAAGGAAVVKHGNRGITSKCGGADVLEALGVRIDLPPAAFKKGVEEIGLGFLFAPAYHPAFKAIMPVRKMLASEGVTTIFNMLGPLLNPVQPPCQLVGVFSAGLLPKFASAFRLLGRKRAWAVHGTAPDEGGVDEVSTMGVTFVHEVSADGAKKFEIDPSVLGFARATPADLAGGDRETNAAIATGILEGAIRDARRDVVVLNAGAALCVAGLAGDLAEGVHRAAEALDSGAALEKLRRLRKHSVDAG